MTSSDLMHECAALEDLFYTEACFYPYPIALLHMLFGPSGFTFVREGQLDVLVMTGSNIRHRVARADAIEDNKSRLAQIALQAMPPRRIIAMLRERSDNPAQVLVHDPYRLAPAAHRVPLCVIGNEHKRSRDINADKLIELALRCRCAVDDICVAEEDVQIDQHTLVKCTLRAGAQTFEPLVYCSTSELAKDYALAAALCRVRN